MPARHPMLDVLLAAAAGTFPAVDGGVDLLPALPGGLVAVLALTGHAYLATDLAPADLADVAPDGFGGALHPAVLARLARGGAIGVVDATLAQRGRGGGGGPLRRTDALDGHPRVRHARAIRSDVAVHADDRGLITIGRGLAGRTELSVEAFAHRQGTGVGRGLVLDALGLVPAGSTVFAAVAPGNARSLRTFLALGFTVLGSEVVIVPARAGQPIADTVPPVSAT